MPTTRTNSVIPGLSATVTSAFAKMQVEADEAEDVTLYGHSGYPVDARREQRLQGRSHALLGSQSRAPDVLDHRDELVGCAVDLDRDPAAQAFGDPQPIVATAEVAVAEIHAMVNPLTRAS